MSPYPYRFITLDPIQLAERRNVLDKYGFYAQISISVPLSLILLYRVGRWCQPRLRVISTRAEKVDCTVGRRNGSASRAHATAAWEQLGLYQNRLAWWLRGPLIRGWSETRAHVLVAGLWGVWLAYLSVAETGTDYLHLTKRLGHIAASQLPLHYFLSLKHPLSPLQLLVSRSHEILNPYHQFLGRIIITLLSLHALLYLNFFIQSGFLVKRIRDRDVLLGIIAVLMFSIIGLSSLAWMRRVVGYQRFYLLHVVLAANLLPVLWFHVNHLRVYVVQAGVIFIANILLRAARTSKAVPAQVSRIEGTDLVRVTVAVSSSSKKRIAGQHAFLSYSQSTSKSWLRSVFWPWHRKNPFTIFPMIVDGVSPYPSKESISFLIRAPSPASGTFTVKLSSITSRPRATPITLHIESPYGSSPAYLQRILLDHKTNSILLVSGGVGATFTIPIYLHLLRYSHSHPQEWMPRTMLIWAVRSLQEAKWGVEILRSISGAAAFQAVIHVTGPCDGGEEVESLFNFAAPATSIQDGRPDRLSTIDDSGSGNSDMTDGKISLAKNGVQILARANGHNRPEWTKVVKHAFPPLINPTSRKKANAAILKDSEREEGSNGIEMASLMSSKEEQANRDSVGETNLRQEDTVKGRTAILVCGPHGMSDDLREEVARYVKRRKEVWWWNEEFGF